jgi:hypothetical protein
VGSNWTVVVTVELLLLGIGSAVAAATVAVFVIVPATLGAVTTMSIVAVVPLGKVPSLQVTVLVPEQVPTLGVAETNVTPGGRGSVTTTPLVVAGIVGAPLLVTIKW